MGRNKNRIGKELICVLLVLFSVIIILLLAASYAVHSRQIDDIFKERTAQLSTSTASRLNGDFLAKLSDTVSSQAYQDLREKAVEENAPHLIEEYLKTDGLLPEYELYTELLATLRESAKAEYLFVQDVGEEDAVCLLDPGRSILSLGVHEKNADEFDDMTSNTRVAPTVSKSKSGWLGTCAEPVQSSGGNASAVICVKLNMNDIVGRREWFLIIMVSMSVVILISMAVVGSVYIRRMVVDPISSLAAKASAFGANGEDDLETLMTQIIEVPNLRDDEINDLYVDIHNMQFGLIRYMKNLTTVTEERERLGTELDIANRIQASMLPNTFPAFPDRDEFDVYALMKPAKSVAGDFYDFFLIDEDHLGVVMADVSGKGIPASLFMMMAKIIINSTAQQNLPPHKVLEKANDRICMNNDADMFVTVWFGIITISTGHVVASNAGHEYPVLQNEDGVYELFRDRHGFVLGGMDGLHFRDYEFDLTKGQTLFLYTDGVPEATTAQNEQFGTERMIEALNRKQTADPQELVHYMLRTVDDFDGDVPQFDDITMLAIRYKGPQDSV